MEELTKYKTEIMTRLASNSEIGKALYYDTPDFLDKPDLDNPFSLLIEKHIYPYRKVQETKEIATTYITISLSNFRSVGNSFKDGYIYIHIISHSSILKTNYGKLRYDYIAHEIDKIMNQVRGIGLGKLEFYEFNEITLTEGFVGQYLCYKPVDFN